MAFRRYCIKLLTALIVAGLPLGFRFLLLRLVPERPIATYLAFPLAYTYTFTLGFYNFQIGCITMLFALGVFLDYRKKGPNLKNLFWLFFLLTVTYFSHLVTFGMTLLVMSGITAADVFITIVKKQKLAPIIRRSLWLLVVAALPLYCMAIYVIHVYDNSEKVYLLNSELITQLMNLRAIRFGTLPQEEVKYGPLFIVLMMLSGILLYNLGNRFAESSGKRSRWEVFTGMIAEPHVLFLIVSAGVLYLYFRLPDSTNVGGYISVRLSYLFLLFLLIWIGASPIRQWILTASVGYMLILQFPVILKTKESFQKEQRLIHEVLQLRHQIKPNSVVLPVHYSHLWHVGHYSNYLGIDKDVVILENYECHNKYFPVRWKKTQPLDQLTRSPWSRLDEILNVTPEKDMKQIDYIFVTGRYSFPDSVNIRLEKSYSLKAQTRHFLLFQRKSKLIQ